MKNQKICLDAECNVQARVTEKQIQEFLDSLAWTSR